MKKFLRSQTLFSHNLNDNSKMNLIKNDATDRKSFINIRRKSQIKKSNDFFGINSKNKKKMSSVGSNLIRVDYLSEKNFQIHKKEQEYEKCIKNLGDLLKSKNDKNVSKDENLLFYLIKTKNKKGNMNGMNKLIDIIKYILSKRQKNEIDILILKEYFSKIDKINILFSSLNSETIFNKLLSSLKFEEYKENNIIFKQDDKGEKLCITLKGMSNVLVQKEGKDGSCTHLEYIKYLIVLYLYQEIGMISKILLYNNSAIKLKEACVLTLFMVFRFFKFYKDQNFFFIDNDIKYEDDAICDFINNESYIKEFIYQKLEFSVEDSIRIFNYPQNVITELYLFYERKIELLSKGSKEESSANYEENDFLNQSEKQNMIYKPSDLEELNIYGEKVQFKYNSKASKNAKKKILEVLFNKIYEIKEISKEKIYNSSKEDYIQRLDFNSIIRDINKDYYLFGNKTLRLKEKRENVKYLNYFDVNIIKEGEIFGELALDNLNKKRTATIITKEICYLAVLDKKIYESYLKMAQTKTRVRNVLFFTEGPIFRGFPLNIFLNEYFYSFKKIFFPKGKQIFSTGEKRTKIYFIEKGEFEFGINITLNEIGKIMDKMGGFSDEKKEKYLCNLSLEFKNIYEKKKKIIKICTVDSKYIIGLDDICLNNKYLFDCRCVSPDGASVYVFDYNKYETALNEYTLIFRNNINYVNEKREFFIKVLFEQRNSLVNLEYMKIKEKENHNEKLNEKNNSKKYNIIGSFIKNVKYNKNKLLTLTSYKNIDNKEKKSENNKEMNINISTEHNNKNSNSYSFIKNINSSNHDSKGNNYGNKTANNFFKNMTDRKNDKNKKFNKTKNFFKPEDKEEIIKNKKKKIFDLELLENNKFNYDFTDTNFIFNEKNKILKSLDVRINQSISIEKRRKRSIIPIITNYKLSLNKKKSNYRSKNKGFKIPSLFKECSKEYYLTTTKSKIKENDNIYLDYQKNVYNIFYPKYSKKFLEIKTFDNDENLISKIFSNKKNKNSYNKYKSNKAKLNIFLNKYKIDRGINVNINKEKELDKNDINYFNVGSTNKNKGFIDCLFFDNWAEKRQFEKNLLKYKIS